MQPDRHPNIPSETEEQVAFVQWLEAKGYKFTSIPNSTFTRSWKQKLHNRAVGLRAGFPDLIVIAEGKIMCVEMKRRKGSKLTPAQSQWIEALNAAGLPTQVCYGVEEAIAFVKSVCLTENNLEL